MYTLSSSSPTS